MSVSNVFGGRFIAIPSWSVSYIACHGSPRDLMVLAGLVGRMNNNNQIADVSIGTLAEDLSTSKETVKRSLKWLAEHYIITVTERPRPSSNVYKINYIQKVMGSKMTPYGVKNDPIKGSKMTPLNDGNGVKFDPIKTDESPASEADLKTLRLIPILDTEIEMVKRVASDNGKVVEMIFGADPDDVRPEEKPKAPKQKPLPEVNDLVSHFVYHPSSVMSNVYTKEDMNILRRAMRLLLNGGLTVSTVKKMIDQFFANYKFSSSESPVLLFMNKSVQESLMGMTGIQLDTNTDPVLVFMINDFNRGDLDLPWDISQDDSLKDYVILYAMDSCYRYPEVVAEIIKKFSGDFSNPDFISSLDSLNSLIKWYIGEEDGDPKTIRYSVSSLSLPKELKANRRVSIRPASATIASAIYTYRRTSQSK